MFFVSYLEYLLLYLSPQGTVKAFCRTGVSIFGQSQTVVFSSDCSLAVRKARSRRSIAPEFNFSDGLKRSVFRPTVHWQSARHGQGVLSHGSFNFRTVSNVWFFVRLFIGSPQGTVKASCRTRVQFSGSLTHLIFYPTVHGQSARHGQGVLSHQCSIFRTVSHGRVPF